MPEYRLVYFDGRGRGEAIRIAFAVAGQVYEDKRIKDNAEWEKVRSVQHCTSAICKWRQETIINTTRENDLYGTNESERTMVDVVLCTLEDLFSEVLKLYMAREDQVKSAEIKEKLEKETIPKFVKIFEEMKKVNSKEKWLVGSKITVADIALFSFFKQLPLMFGESLAKVYNDNTTLKTHANVVQENPGIKKWIEAHPPKKNN
ncbi:glutathione S-transferase 1-like [Argopecten irradians]|uniref:glutathione S-transferase 1-like n=1 Tax=Argopecten irradians TaxID=31199 RepID=UPI003712ACCC